MPFPRLSPIGCQSQAPIRRGLRRRKSHRPPERRSRRRAVPRGTAPQTVTSQNRRSPVREIASGENSAGRSRELQDTVEEAIHPLRSSPVRNAEGNKAKFRGAAHRRDVAEAPRKGLPSSHHRLVSFAPEVHRLDEHVAGEKQIVGRAPGAVNGAIVPDPEHDGLIRTGLPQPFSAVR